MQVLQLVKGRKELLSIFVFFEVMAVAVYGLKFALLGGGFLCTLFGVYYVIKEVIERDKPQALLYGLCLFLTTIMAIHGWWLTAVTVVFITAFLFFYYALRTLLYDSVVALFISVVAIIGISYFPSQYFTFTSLSMVGIALVIMFIQKKGLRKIFSDDLHRLQLLDSIDIFVWIIIFTSIVFLGMKGSQYFYFRDWFHPIYELSIGQSYRQALFNTPDLSYAGKILRFHFLSTQLPFFFSTIFHVSLLISLYFIVPLFYSLVSFILITLFFIQYGRVKYPIFFIFFMPSICIYKIV